MQACSTSGRAHIAGRPSAHSMGAAAPRPCWQRHVSRPYVARQTRICATKQTFTSFDDMIANSQAPVLVDFAAQWCGPCQMLAPVLKSVSSRLGGRLKVVKIDTDKYPAIATAHKIQALPTLILFKNGRPVDRIEGLPNEQQLVERLEYFLQG